MSILPIYHEAGIGTTGSGKTHQALSQAKREKIPTIIINPKHETEGYEGFYACSEGDFKDSDHLIRLLKKGINLNYFPTKHLDTAFKEIQLIVDRLFDLKHCKIIFDEAEKYGYQGKKSSGLIDVAERGRALKVKGVFLIQDPANISKTILRMCDTKKIFRVDEFGEDYLSKKGYNMDKIKELWASKGEFSYVEYFRGQLKGVYKEPWKK